MIAFFNRIIYLIGVKSGIAYVICYYYVKIKIDSYYSLPFLDKVTFESNNEEGG